MADKDISDEVSVDRFSDGMALPGNATGPAGWREPALFLAALAGVPLPLLLAVLGGTIMSFLTLSSLTLVSLLALPLILLVGLFAFSLVSLCPFPISFHVRLQLLALCSSSRYEPRCSGVRSGAGIGAALEDVRKKPSPATRLRRHTRWQHAASAESGRCRLARAILVTARWDRDPRDAQGHRHGDSASPTFPLNSCHRLLIP